jgi:tRNA(His) 5'-end guanylyltransferase
VELKFPPTFDGRIILYPSVNNLKDYFSWRQVDCHINNLYNTTFWALVLMGKLTKDEAHNKLKGTFSKDKHEILFKEFMINYNSIEEIYKRGTIIFKSEGSETKMTISKKKEKEEIIDDISIKIEEIELEPKINLEKFSNLTDKLLLQDEEFVEKLKFYNQLNIFLSHEDVIQPDFWTKFAPSTLK